MQPGKSSRRPAGAKENPLVMRGSFTSPAMVPPQPTWPCHRHSTSGRPRRIVDLVGTGQVRVSCARASIRADVCTPDGSAPPPCHPRHTASRGPSRTLTRQNGHAAAQTRHPALRIGDVAGRGQSSRPSRDRNEVERPTGWQRLRVQRNEVDRRFGRQRLGVQG